MDHEAEVEAFVQLPPIVQFSEPNAMYEAADAMSTFPVIVTFPDVEVSAPPESVRFPATESP